MRDKLALAPAAKDEARRDRQSTLPTDPGIARAVEASLDWLGVAQDESTSRDGGIARHYSLISGWAASYPETSGYIVPTLVRGAPGHAHHESRERARRVLDWLVAIQLPDGAFAGGVIGQTPVVPVTFNTGQILIGLASGVVEFGNPYRAPMRRAADWLVRTQHPDGAWRDHPTPFAGAGEKSYETHVAWGLLEAARIDPDRGYGDAALRNIRWALTKQGDTGWFADCCLTDPVRPLAHTIGYVLRGILEGYRYSRDAALLDAALKTANGALSALSATGMLPGRLTSSWSPAAKWSCLTGSVQIAHCWLMLFQFTGEQKFLDAARRTNAYVRARVRVDGPREIRGAVKGSYPVDGEYGQFEYLNWACKFFIDSNILEQEIVASLGGVVV
ncbi:MAG: prenyltransferase/squalene oxidase repeat-containing protein [Gemmatimonadota bacterium]